MVNYYLWAPWWLSEGGRVSFMCGMLGRGSPSCAPHRCSNTRPAIWSSNGDRLEQWDQTSRLNEIRCAWFSKERWKLARPVCQQPQAPQPCLALTHIPNRKESIENMELIVRRSQFLSKQSNVDRMRKTESALGTLGNAYDGWIARRVFSVTGSYFTDVYCLPTRGAPEHSQSFLRSLWWST